jgi:predicted metal-dependent enzyme (double-stranded beta helix superfamily)
MTTASTIPAPQTTATTSPSLTRLIAAVRSVVQRENDCRRVGENVAALLQPYLGFDDFLTPEQLEPDVTKYRQHILHVEPDGSFSIVALDWLPGQCTAIHDHVSWCVVGVHRGQEHETVYELADETNDPHLRVTGHAINPCGCAIALVPPGDIHHVANDGDGLAVSLHIYGADIGKLGSSIRRRYNLEVRGA